MPNWKAKVTICQGDITDEDCHVIVNAANEDLRRGGGVCGAIHMVAGPELEEACDDIGGCPTGEAVMTDAFDLPCKKVIHAVGPIYGGGAGQEEASLLESCYLESMNLCAAEGFSSIAFPGISTGTYGYPLEEACQIALESVKLGLEENPEITDVRMVCFTLGDLDQYERIFGEME
ncbi:MAG: macro domain-containing protein [bacterium]|nr:macro domain-containing protein [bacterium]